MEVGRVHIQIGDFFFWEEGEHTNSEEDGDPWMLTLRRGQVSPAAQDTRFSLQSMCATKMTSLVFKPCFHFYIVTEDLLQVKGCLTPSIENRIQGPPWSDWGQGLQPAQRPLSPSSCPVRAASDFNLLCHWEVRLRESLGSGLQRITQTPSVVRDRGPAH